MTLFDLSGYNIRQLDPAQGTKPLDFGGGGITGSINLDGRFIAINTYHPEHGYITLTSIPPFPDEDRYDQKKVRAYRKSLVTNEGFGLQFEQEIIKREYFLIEDAVPFIHFTLGDGTIAECVTHGGVWAFQQWKFSSKQLQANFTGNVWLMRTAYTQLTEGGVIHMPDKTTEIDTSYDKKLVIKNETLKTFALFPNLRYANENNDGSVNLHNEIVVENDHQLGIFLTRRTHILEADWVDRVLTQSDFRTPLSVLLEELPRTSNNLVLKRASVYAGICSLHQQDERVALLTDHMLLPLSWNRDAYYTMQVMPFKGMEDVRYVDWLLGETWRGAYCQRLRRPIPDAWGRSYMANGQQKDSRSFQLDQQIFPLLSIADVHDHPPEISEDYSEEDFKIGQLAIREHYLPYVLRILKAIKDSEHEFGLYVTDETPADDDIPLNLHFSSHALLWYALKRIDQIYPDIETYPERFLELWMKVIKEKILKHFITEHKGKKIYAYATDSEGNYYLYHDANDIPLVMMPLWGFCEKDDEIWLNTIEFAFSDDNPGFYDGVLGSVHTPSAWALGDAQELIYCKVVGDRERYQRVWERVEKAAQWDGALPEAYDANTFEVVSRHWFAWPNAMVAIADSIPWNWEEEGEYAR